VAPSGTSANERVILAALRDGAVVSRADLARSTGLPKTTVTGVIARLLRRGLVVEHGAPQRSPASGRGRPPGRVALAGPTGSVAVISLSHPTIRTGVVGYDGVIQTRRDAPLRRDEGQQRVLDRALRLLASPGDPAGCAVIGVPAPFQRGVGVLAGRVPEEVRTAVPELPDVFGWLTSDPVPVIAQRLGVPVTADNDANLGALGEATFGAGRGIDSFIYLKAVEGLGAGLILNGRLYRGARGLAGELAHIQVRDDGPWCACGGRGCLAHSFGGFVEPFVESAYQRPLRVRYIVGLPAAGDPGTDRFVADAGRRVGRALADTCMMLNPEAIVVDGMLAAAAQPFLAGMREMIDRHTAGPVAESVRILSGSLGDRAELLGAVALARIERLDEQAL
jgi:predicted NBD/HSP70 family sugar kinase